MFPEGSGGEMLPRDEDLLFVVYELAISLPSPSPFLSSSPSSSHFFIFPYSLIHPYSLFLLPNTWKENYKDIPNETRKNKTVILPNRN